MEHHLEEPRSANTITSRIMTSTELLASLELGLRVRLLAVAVIAVTGNDKVKLTVVNFGTYSA